MTRLLAAVLLAFPGLAAASPSGPEAHYSLPAAGRGVEVVLHSGQEIEGVLLRVAGETAWIAVDQGEVGLGLDEIASARPRGGATAEFRRRLAALAPSDRPGLWALAVWADENGLYGSARELARRLGRRLPREEAFAAAGLVESDGVWVAPTPKRRDAPKPAAPSPVVVEVRVETRIIQPMYAVSGWILPSGGPRLRGTEWPPRGDYVLPMRHGQTHAPFITRRTE